MSVTVDPDRPRDEDEDVREDDASPSDENAACDPFADLHLDQAAMDAVRKAVHDRVSRAFRGSVNEHDIEDATSAALEALLNEHRRAPVGDMRAFTATVGFRAAREINRRPRAVPFDPLDSPALEQEDPTASPVEHIDARARVARIAEALEQLDDDKLAAFHLRIVEDLSHEEACERLGLGRSAYFERVKVAKARVEGAVELSSHVFERRQRQLLSDYVAGIADERARARAERLIAADPQAAVLARELRRSHEDAVLVLPTLALVEIGQQDAAGRLGDLLDRAREVASGWLGRGPDPSELASSPALAAGGARGAGAAGAGLLAKALGGIGAGKVALGCLGGGAAATIACVATGVLPLPSQGGEREAAPHRSPEKRVGPPERPARQARIVEAVERRPAAPTPTKPSPPPEAPPTSDARDESAEPAAAPQPASALEPDVAPEVQEFGVAAAGTPVGGAPPDTNDADGASASSVRQEFGP
ncbi:MAG: hypothetical protein GEU88_10200 [Solirubrobacterales bacterium]|nr:hypothetical protein [Solirubrobacterales bacterium]